VHNIALQRTPRCQRAAAERRSFAAPFWRSLAIGLVVLAGVACAGDSRPPDVFEIPENYQGWVAIEFSRPECQPIPAVDGKLVFRIPASGYLCTSSSPTFGVATDQYWYVGKNRTQIHQTGWGGGGLIWDEATGESEVAGKPKRVFMNFFVGTEQQERKAPQFVLPGDPKVP
jgi:hypothetical protein